MLRDRLAHRLARLRIVERVVGRSLRDAERLRGDAGAGAVEDAHRDLEPLAFRPEQVRGRDATVVERELARRRPRDAHLRLEARHLEARRVGLDDERRDAGVPGGRIRLREHRVERRHARVGDEPLGAVEHVLVAVASRGRAHGGRVGAGAGFGERVRAQRLAAREPRQPLVLLLAGARELQPERAELLHGEDERRGRAHLRHLFDRDQSHQRPGAEAAVRLVEEEAEDVVLAEELDHVPGELVGGVDLGRPRRDALPRERSDEVAKLALLRCELIPGH